MIVEVKNIQEMHRIGETMSRSFRGGEVIELIGDVGAGKTTFTKGIARGLGIEDPIQSPSFTISQTYDAREGLRLVHYDFYRLYDPGIMADELSETIADENTITVVEWADTVANILPAHRIRISIKTISEEERTLTIESAEGVAVV